MSSYMTNRRHKKTGEVHEIFAIDDCFAPHVYGYKTPDGEILTGQQFRDEYEPSEDL